MVLHIDSDAAYLVMPESLSVYAGHFISVIGLAINLYKIRAHSVDRKSVHESCI